MQWKTLFKVDKTRIVWFFLSTPLSLLLSLLLFLLLERLFTLHVPMVLYLVFSAVVSYLVGYVVDSVHTNLADPHHKTIFIAIKITVMVVSLGLLGVLLLGILAANTMVAKKPAIYLYPEQDMQVTVQVNINGKMIADDSSYGTGWTVFATKEGLIYNTDKPRDKSYDYLFYEAELFRLILPSEGWIVAKDDLNLWFSQNLAQMGLNEKEIAQFKEYWMEELGKSKYYEIRLLSDEFLKDNMELIVKPQPDTMIRLNFYFKGHEKPINIYPPHINSRERKGFTLVEWGGILE